MSTLLPLKTSLVTTWRRRLDASAPYLLLVGVVVSINSFSEWFFYSAWPLWTNDPSIVAENELDWSVAPFCDSHTNSTSDRLATGLFSFAAILYDIVTYLAILWFALIMLRLRDFLDDQLEGVDKRSIVANIPQGSAPFDRYVRLSWLFIMFACTWLYLTRLQNAYLHNPVAGINSLPEFIKQDLLHGFTTTNFQPGAYIFDGLRFDLNGVQMSVLSVVLFLVWMMLVHGLADVFGKLPIPKSEYRFRVTLLIFAVIGIVLYRLILFWVGAAVLILCCWAAAEVKRRFTEKEGDTQNHDTNTNIQ